LQVHSKWWADPQLRKKRRKKEEGRRKKEEGRRKAIIGEWAPRAGRPMGVELGSSHSCKFGQKTHQLSKHIRMDQLYCGCVVVCGFHAPQEKAKIYPYIVKITGVPL